MKKNKSKRIALLAALMMLLTMLSVPMTGYAAEGDVLKYKTGSDFYFSYSDGVEKGAPIEEAEVNAPMSVYVNGDLSGIENVTWKTKNSDIVAIEPEENLGEDAVVKASAMVTPKKTGIAVITAVCGDKSITMYFNVVKAGSKRVELGYKSKSGSNQTLDFSGDLPLTVNDECEVTAKVGGENVDVTWLVPDNDSFEVTNNALKGLKPTEASNDVWIIPTDKSIRASCFYVCVNDGDAEDTEAYTIRCNDILEVGESQSLEVYDENDVKYEGDITWDSPNTDIASIDADGTMTGHAKGVVTIKAEIDKKEVTTQIGVGHFTDDYDTNEDGFIAYDFNTKLGISTKDDFYRLKKKWASVELSSLVYMTEYDQKAKKSKLIDPSQYTVDFSTNDTELIDVTPEGKVTAKAGVGNAIVNLSATYKGKTYQDEVEIDIEDYASVDELLYVLDRDTKEATLETVPQDSTISSIPKTISVEQENYAVVAIGVGAFYYCEEIKEMTIPEGVKTISERAFYGCTNLKSITLPDSIETIGEMAIGYLDDDEDSITDKNLVIHCSNKNKAAIDYAKENGLKLVIDN